MLKTDIWAESQVTLYPSYTVNQIRIGASRIKAHQVAWNVCTVSGGIWKYTSKHTFTCSKVCAFIMLTRCYFMTQMSQCRCIDLLACILEADELGFSQSEQKEMERFTQLP